MRRRRTRTWAKWAATVACVVIAAALCVSLRWRTTATVFSGHPSGAFSRGAILWNGALGYTCGESAPGPSVHGRVELSFERTDFSLIRRPIARGTLQNGLYYLPLWIPFILILVPAGLLWRADYIVAKRARTGRCLECNYDRRGLAQGAPCPECGEPPAPPPPR